MQVRAVVVDQVEKIRSQLAMLIEIVKKRDFEALKDFFDALRLNIELPVKGKKAG